MDVNQYIPEVKSLLKLTPLPPSNPLDHKLKFLLTMIRLVCPIPRSRVEIEYNILMKLLTFTIHVSPILLHPSQQSLP